MIQYQTGKVVRMQKIKPKMCAEMEIHDQLVSDLGTFMKTPGLSEAKKYSQDLDQAFIQILRHPYLGTSC
jgi:hypothetical protein